ncbi:uncharacterized protein MONOS_4696 [Monocercomonoides exilis]|uniref:uncharacterized protein n=1 Tax=Monocercomonoides exilis TaxID=2049356 RepID=UPI003559879C|nr:hypothetical protein MONOS_4696 [Monocercomonoides exilis]|eukprot:MONOS_4696.1-p1 / transcript=MONOS_4696.1 / gene=MONOS_4696 / organism=Monocercomonoides_exilis_PA203 / gene_product=unspecified product / transcript_product=unspecified product / location=Mono_scaffold00127:111889-112803(+) / protein_length=179 / sequence_SO=supercontig / SO=protein_coding / is_pseudo=false
MEDQQPQQPQSYGAIPNAYEGAVGSTSLSQPVAPQRPWFRRAFLDRFTKSSLKTVCFWAWIAALIGDAAYFIGSIIAWAIYRRIYQIILPFFGLLCIGATVIFEIGLVQPQNINNPQLSGIILSFYTRAVIYFILCIPCFVVPSMIFGATCFLVSSLLYIASGCQGESVTGESKYQGIV